jgi:hypothetical protein
LGDHDVAPNGDLESRVVGLEGKPTRRIDAFERAALNPSQLMGIDRIVIDFERIAQDLSARVLRIVPGARSFEIAFTSRFKIYGDSGYHFPHKSLLATADGLCFGLDILPFKSGINSNVVGSPLANVDGC